jgi:hypothetical protein
MSALEKLIIATTDSPLSDKCVLVCGGGRTLVSILGIVSQKGDQGLIVTAVSYRFLCLLVIKQSCIHCMYT